VEPARLTPLLRPALARHESLSSLMVTHESGHGYMLLQLPDAFRSREVLNPDFPPGEVEWTAHEGGESPRLWREELDYDPRTRPWFQEAMAAPEGHPIWTAPYTFFTTQDPGITTAMRVPDPAGDTMVVGLDLLLSDISAFTTELEISPHGRALVLADDGRVIGLPPDERFASVDGRREAVLKPVDELDLPVATAAWAAREEGSGAFAIDVAGETWWAGHDRFEVGDGQSFWIQVLVPEKDFLAGVERERNIVLGVAFLALLLAVSIALLMARAYSRPLETLVRQADRIRTLDLEEAEPIDSRLAEVKELGEAQDRMRSALRSFSRYVPLELVRELIRRGNVARQGGHRAEVSILFSDIQGFTSDSERMSAEAMARHIGDYFDALLPVVRDHRGTVDKLIGDAIMAFWNEPTRDPEHARDALETVLTCRERLAELRREWEAKDLPLLLTRFGLHTGEVIVGNIGSTDRLTYTILGDAVNLAARLEGANKSYGTFTLVSEAFKDAVGEGYEWRWVDRVAVKGRAEAVDVFEPLGREGEVGDERLAFRDRYEAAFTKARERDFDGALAILAELDGDDVSVALLRERCERWKAEAPAEGWAGESRLTSK
jgi:adenylate cyclase